MGGKMSKNKTSTPLRTSQVTLSGRAETAIANPEEESPCPATALEPSSSPGARTVSLNPVFDPLSKVARLLASDRHHISL